MKIAAAIVSCAIVLLGTVTLSAHLITSKGKVTAVEKEAVKVDVVDPETKKVTPRKFLVDEETKVLRDDKLVKFADARIRKGETITVTVDHDLDEDLAHIIRLGTTKK
ncbi:MAG TPA: hypothetical protein VMZ90_05690 [Vicinamibacterales bacterium]|nr:hypothetical protein [Vicinamibacterales bacterium]